ncbi:hypothetical protein [Cupriavidus nantongensis]|uniref:hypothetical protein n=1 Tax=Cupriavidus nantongensis TaxID=1796606 RepID=UPI0022453F8E|nr:hypothetical protein [Cupriavidus nantongensis]
MRVVQRRRAATAADLDAGERIGEDVPSPEERFVVLRQLFSVVDELPEWQGSDLTARLVELGKQQQSYGPYLMALALATGKKSTTAWQLAFNALASIEPKARDRMLSVLARRINWAPKPDSAWDAVLALTNQLPPTDQQQPLLGLAHGLPLLPVTAITPSLSRLLSHCTSLPRATRLATMQELCGMQMHPSLWIDTFGALRLVRQRVDLHHPTKAEVQRVVRRRARDHVVRL